MCSRADYNRYGYGTKAVMQIEVGKGDPDRLTPILQNYAKEKGLFYSGGGGWDPKPGGRKTLTHILQSASFQVDISISADSTQDAARVSISTFSFSCGPITDDWRPYWRAFKAFLQEKHFKRLPAQFTPPE